MSSATRFCWPVTTFYNGDEENFESLVPFVPEMKLQEGWARMAGRDSGIGLEVVTRDGICVDFKVGKMFVSNISDILKN